MDPAETFYIPTALALIADLLASATRLRPPRIPAPEVASFKGGTSHGTKTRSRTNPEKFPHAAAYEARMSGITLPPTSVSRKLRPLCR